MTGMTTSDLTATAAKHIVRAIRDGLGVSAMNARRIYDIHVYHLTFVEEGEDLRGIEARVRPGTPIGTTDACFDLFLDGSWKGAFRAGSVATRREGYVDEAMEQARMFAVRGAVSGMAPKIDYGAQARERVASGRAGDVIGTVWACERHPMDTGCARIDVLSDDGETYVLAVVPIMGNTAQQNFEFAREKVGQRLRMSWVRAPEFCADYEIGDACAAAMEDEMVVDFFLEAPFRPASEIASAAGLLEGAALREARLAA
jgi:hypothetical protein